MGALDPCFRTSRENEPNLLEERRTDERIGELKPEKRGIVLLLMLLTLHVTYLIITVCVHLKVAYLMLVQLCIYVQSAPSICSSLIICSAVCSTTQ